MGIYNGTQQIGLSGIEKVYCGNVLVYQKTAPSTGSYTLLHINSVDVYSTLNIYKEDTSTMEVYMNDVLQHTVTTSGAEELSMPTTTSSTNTIKIVNNGGWYFNGGCLSGYTTKQSKLDAVDFSHERYMTKVGTGVHGQGQGEHSEGAFYYCKLLTSVILPSSVTAIMYKGFSECTALTSVTIPNGVTSIGAQAFYINSALLTIDIPALVSYIGYSAFANPNGAMALTSMYFRQPSGMTVTLPTAGSSTGMCYRKTAGSCTIYTDNETIKNYDWATDNVTATILHLDGTAWE